MILAACTEIGILFTRFVVRLCGHPRLSYEELRCARPVYVDLHPGPQVLPRLPLRYLHRRYHADVHDMDQHDLQPLPGQRVSYDFVLCREVDLCWVYHLLVPAGA